ncbi:MAG: CoA transferase, partial [Sphingomonadales bacterium]|nr:CoA transferase [Sphingomonadales bacterium]
MTESNAPLTGLRIVLIARSVAAAYAGRLLGTMGAEVLLVEPPQGSSLRREPPFLSGDVSALFAYLAAGMRSRVCELDTEHGRATLTALLSEADILIDDTPLCDRVRLGLDEAGLAQRHPDLIHVSVLPFGAYGPKAEWKGEDIQVQHASGEGYLLPNGLAVEMFPDRAPLKVHGHFGSMQGGIA